MVLGTLRSVIYSQERGCSWASAKVRICRVDTPQVHTRGQDQKGKPGLRPKQAEVKSQDQETLHCLGFFTVQLLRAKDPVGLKEAEIFPRTMVKEHRMLGGGGVGMEPWHVFFSSVLKYSAKT